MTCLFQFLEKKYALHGSSFDLSFMSTSRSWTNRKLQMPVRLYP